MHDTIRDAGLHCDLHGDFINRPNTANIGRQYDAFVIQCVALLEICQNNMSFVLMLILCVDSFSIRVHQSAFPGSIQSEVDVPRSSFWTICNGLLSDHIPRVVTVALHRALVPPGAPLFPLACGPSGLPVQRNPRLPE